jgi:hypothetical protein
MKALNVRKFAQPSAGLRPSSFSLVEDRFHSSNTLDPSKCASRKLQCKTFRRALAPIGMSHFVSRRSPNCATREHVQTEHQVQGTLRVQEGTCRKA